MPGSWVFGTWVRLQGGRAKRSGLSFVLMRGNTVAGNQLKRNTGQGLPPSWAVALKGVDQMLELFDTAGVEYVTELGQPRSVEVLAALFVEKLSAAATSRAFKLDYGKVIRTRKYVVNRLRPHLREGPVTWQDVTVSVPLHLVSKFRALEKAAHQRQAKTKLIKEAVKIKTSENENDFQ
jgi:hypothetical protein